MIDEFDEALREFLIRELPVRDNEIDIAFDQPSREWSARLSRPTLNLFLRDLRENSKLRAPHPNLQQTVNGDSMRIVRQPVRVDLFYMATAWANDPLDEHRILSRMLSVLFRYREIPPDILAQHVAGQDAGVPLKMAQYDTQPGTSDLWSVLDNELRPAVDLVATVTIHPHVEFEVPLVREVDVQFKQITRQPPVGRVSSSSALLRKVAASGKTASAPARPSAETRSAASAASKPAEGKPARKKQDK